MKPAYSCLLGMEGGPDQTNQSLAANFESQSGGIVSKHKRPNSLLFHDPETSRAGRSTGVVDGSKAKAHMSSLLIKLSVVWMSGKL